MSSAEYRRTHKTEINAYNRARRARNPEILHVKAHTWYKNHIDISRSYGLKYKYGITLQDYNNLFDKQKGTCAICGIHQVEVKHTMVVDHNHETGKIRGLLCDNCNKGLGFFQDSVEYLTKARVYLNVK
jgi:hypothetical protein